MARMAAAWLVPIGALPLLVAQPAPLQDWPNHLARVHILDLLLRGDPFWSRFYVINTFRVPNVALDLGVLGLTRLGLAPAMAGSAFLLLTYALFVGGFGALARRFGAVGPARLAAAVSLFYTGPLFWGLVNYVFATGALLCLLALWLGAASPPWRRLAVAVLGAAILFFCHLIAAVAFAGALACFETWAIWERRSWQGSPWQLSSAGALLTVVLLMRAAPHEPLLAIDYLQTQSLAALLRWKFVIFAKLPVGATQLYRAVTLAGAVAAGGVALAARPALRASGAALLATGGLVLLALAVPNRIGGGALLDERLALLPVLLGTAAIQVAWRRPAWGAAAAAAASVAALARVLTLAIAWSHTGAAYAAYDLAVARLVPRGAMMLMGAGRKLDRVEWPEFWSKPYTSIETQAVFHGIFVPMVFASPLQQPIALRPGFDAVNELLDLSSGDEARHSLARLQTYCSGPQKTDFPAIAITRLYAPPPNPGPPPLYAAPGVQVFDACRLAASRP